MNYGGRIWKHNYSNIKGFKGNFLFKARANMKPRGIPINTSARTINSV